MLIAIASILVAGSVFLIAWAASGVIAGAAARLRERYVVRDLGDLQDLLLFIDARALVVLGICTGALLLGLGLLALGGVFTWVLAIAGLFAPWAIVHRYRLRRIRAFETQLVDSLQALANALRAGLSLQQGLEAVAREAPSPMGQELGIVVKELRIGVALEDALTHLADRVASDDLALTVTSANIARQAGGNMAEMFETIAATVRERFRLEGKIAALTSQGKLQGWIVAALPLLLGGTMGAIRPDLVDPMVGHLFGYGLVALVLLLEATGLFLIRRIVNVDV